MNKMRVIILTLLLSLSGGALASPDAPHILIHLRTGMADDSKQLLASYDVIWAALEEGLTVKVLIDADALLVYKRGWRGKDLIEKRPLPQLLRHSLARQFSLSLEQVPNDYGHYLALLHDKGATFYLNGSAMVAAGIEEHEMAALRLSADFFLPINLREMIDLRASSELYLAY